MHFIHKQYDTQTVNSVNVSVIDVQQSFLVDSYSNVIVKNVCEDRAQINSNKAPSNASYVLRIYQLTMNQTINHSCTFGEKGFSEASQSFNSSQNHESSPTINQSCIDGEKDFSEASQSFNSSQNHESSQTIIITVV